MLQTDDQTDRPTLIECIRFRGKKKRINIPQEIGVKYREFGLFLLEDHNGARIHALTLKNTWMIQMKSQQKSLKIEEWVAGKGKQPVTWKYTHSSVTWHWH